MKKLILSLLLSFFILSIMGQTTSTVTISFVMNKTLPPSYTFSTDFKGEVSKCAWYFGDEGSSEQLSPTYTFKYTKNYVVNVKILDKANVVWYGKMEAPFEGASVVTPACKALFTPSIVPTSNNTTEGSKKVSFKNQSTGEIKECSWIFGDETKSADLNPVHEYSKYGEYKVCLVIVTASGCKSDYCITVKLADPSVPVILYGKGYVKDLSSVSGCKWGIVIDNTTVLLPVEMAMPFEFKAGQQVEFAYELLKNTATTCMSGNPVKIHKIAEIAVTPACKALYTYSLATPTAADVISKKVIFTNKSTDNIKECVWYFGDETKSTDLNPVHEYAKYGEYKVCLSINTSDGCKSEYCSTVKVGTSATPVILSGKGYVKDVSSISGCKWAIVLEEGTILLPVEMAVNFEFKAGQKVELAYEILASTATVCQAGKPVKIDKIAEIPITAACKAYFTATNALWSDPSMMKKVVFSNQSSGDITYCKWTFGDGATSTDLKPVHEYPKFGEYKVCLVIETGSGCRSEFCSAIKVDSVSSANQCAFDLVIKPKEQTVNTFLFYALSKVEIKSWKWSFGDGKTSDVANPSHTYDKPGVYEVNCTINTSFGCTTSRTTKFTVQAPALPLCPGAFSLVLFNPAGSATVCNGKAVVTLLDEKVKPYTGVKYIWSHGSTGDTVKNLCPNKQYVVQAVIEGVCQKSTSFSFLTTPEIKVEAANGKYAFNVVSPAEDVIYRWEFGDGNVAYGSAVDYSFSKEGNYEVKLTAISGDYSAESTLKVAAIQNMTPIEETALNDLRIFPNPVKDYIWVDFIKPVSGQVFIEIFDMKGNKVNSRNLFIMGQQFIETNTEKLENGIYFLRVTNNEKTITGLKFLKNK
jgi:PKD repeat protein